MRVKIATTLEKCCRYFFSQLLSPLSYSYGSCLFRTTKASDSRQGFLFFMFLQIYAYVWTRCFVLSERIVNALWGIPTLVLFVLCGSLFTVRTHCVQLTGAGKAIKCFFAPEKEKETEISAFQSVCTALAASIGTGNIVGVCAALSAGGAGAVFWMCVSAWIGEATAYAENYLGMLYRERDGRKRLHGGAMYTMKNGLAAILGNKAAKAAATVYAVLSTFAALTMGNAVQINTAASVLGESFGIPAVAIGCFCAGSLLFLLHKGRGSVAKLTEKLVPVSCFVFFVSCLCVLVFRRHSLPFVFRDIFCSAFGRKSVSSGFSAAALRNAVVIGVRRGVFSNEAGLGTSVCVHTAVEGATPQEQGLRSMTEVFIDTVVMCTLTAVCVLSVPGAVLCAPERMFTFALSSLFGAAAGKIAAICLSLFAFSTFVGWCFFGNENIYFLFGSKAAMPFAVAFCLVAVLASRASFAFVWQLADFVNALLAFINIFTLLLLAKEIKIQKMTAQ